ncbi:MAG TPA: hypothetical protein VIA06_15315 [Candidatus Dormibacteraeota bacterium]|nr:hypothetical protein [Candidatus Dormibacteraeota bacterium]
MSDHRSMPRTRTLGLTRTVLVAAIDDALRENAATQEASGAIAGAVADVVVANNEELSRQLAALLDRFELEREYPRS